MLDVSTINKNLKVAELKLTENCDVSRQTLIFAGTNMLQAYLRHII
jgi:hypothetical protein